jgi:hypothetical protein
MFARWMALTSSLLGMMALGCGKDGADPKGGGGLVVVVDTDLTLPQDIDKIRVQVTQVGKVLLDEDHPVGPGQLLVPAEFRVSWPGNNQPVIVRGVASKNGQPRIERSAVTPVPSMQQGLVRLPLNYLCDGTANADGTSTCGDGQTCKQGTCRTSMIPELPVYSAADAGIAPDGAVTAAGMPGTCFDVLACFADAAPVVVEEVTCTFPVPAMSAAGRLNVAIALPLGGRGICNDKGCWVALEAGPEGFAVEGSRVRLPEALCRPRADGSRLSVVVSTACATKTPAAPPCGAWSRENTPIESPKPRPPVSDACIGVLSEACGNCGMRTRQCQNGTLSEWSACTGQGQCVPGASQACGMGGTQMCDATCRFTACMGQTCAGPASQPCGNCGMQTRTCANGVWSGWSACAGEGACAPNASQSCGAGGTRSCGGTCQWGACGNQSCTGPATQLCGACGTQGRTCDSSTGQWSAWSACTSEGVCSPNATRACANGTVQTCGGSCQWGECPTSLMCVGEATMACGNCGTRTRTCDPATGTWSAWSACGAEGACQAGATQSCGHGGTQMCGGNCQWGAACQNQTCDGPVSETCGNCGTRNRTCDTTTGQWSAWSACTGEGVCKLVDTRACHNGGTQGCTAMCQWETGCHRQMCPGPAMEACGNCGTRSRSCDPETGGWSSWSACTGEGVCAASSTRSCGNMDTGTQTCTASCQWALACTDQECTGPDTEDCGTMCGKRTRVCDTDTGNYGEWGACMSEGVCSPGDTQPCGMGQSQTCTAMCAWGMCGCPMGQMVCNGTCTDTQSNSDNCGACGNKCLAGNTCVAGGCTCASGLCGTILTTTGRPADLSLSGSTIFWTNQNAAANGGGIMTIETSGSNEAQLIAEDSPNEIAVGGGRVMWTRGGGLYSQLQDGSGSATLVQGPGPETGVAQLHTDGVYAYYWFDYNRVRRSPIAGGSSVVVYTGPFNSNVVDMAMTNHDLFFINNGVWNGSFSAKLPQTAFVARSVGGAFAGLIDEDLDFLDASIAADATYAFWAYHGALWRSSHNGSGLVVFNGFGSASQMISDGTNLYALLGSTILKAPVSNPTAASRINVVIDPRGISTFALDGSNVYWISANGRYIARAPK